MSDKTADNHPPVHQEDSRDVAGTCISITSTAILCAALVSPLAALPYFDTGYFNLVAASIILLHFCAGAGAAVIVIALLFRRPGTTTQILNPISVGVFLFAVLSAIPALYADHPLLVLLGSPQSGKGVLWFIDIAVFAALAFLVRQSRWSIIVICLTAVIVIGIVSAILGYARSTHTLLLLRGGDSYAYLGLLLPFFAFLPPGEKAQRRLCLLFCTVGALCIWAANNKSAAIVFVAFGVLFLLFLKVPRLARTSSRLRLSVVYPAILIISGSLAYILVTAEFRGLFDSIDSRLLIADIAAAAQFDATPIEWLFGHGWGHTQSGLYRNLTESGTSLLDNKWDFLWRDIFHSHNLVLELVYETGIAGFAAFITLLSWLATQVGPAQRAAALAFVFGYVFMNSVWFEFAHSVPFLAVALCALARETRLDWHILQHRAAAPALYSSILLVCLAGSAALLNFAINVKPFKADRGALEKPAYPVQAFPTDPRGNDFIRASVYRDSLRLLKPVSKPAAAAPKDVVRNILDDIETRLEKTRSPELLLVGLVIFNDATFDAARSWMKPVIRGRESLWDRLIEKHLELAPKRTDVLVVYMSWLATSQRKEDLKRIVATILRTNANEPVGLYFQGVLDTQDPSNQIKRRGLSMIAQALENGVERYVEVPDWLKKLAISAKASHR